MATATASSSVNGRLGVAGSPMTVRGGLPFLVGLEVVLEMNADVGRSIGLLRPVFEVDLGKRQAHGFRSGLPAVARMRDASDDDVVHLDDEEFVLAFACLPMRDGRFLEVRSGGTR